MMKFWIACAISVWPISASAQIGSGASLPSNCNTGGGSLFYLTAGDPGLYVCENDTWTKKVSPGGSTVWGGITGTLADQTDLQTALDEKGTSNFSGAYADLTGKPALGTVAPLNTNGNAATYLNGAGAFTTPEGGGGLATGDIILRLSACGAGYEEATELNGKTLIGTLAANGDVGTTGGSDTITDVINHTHPVTDPGHVHVENTNSAATGGLRGSTPDTSTNTSVASGYSTASATTGVTTTNPAGGVASVDNRSSFVRVIFCRRQ